VLARPTLKAQLDGAWLGSFFVKLTSLIKNRIQTRQAGYMARLNTILYQWRQFDIKRAKTRNLSEGWNSSNWLTAKLLMALASTVILGSESRATHGHIFLFHYSGSRPPHRKHTESAWQRPASTYSYDCTLKGLKGQKRSSDCPNCFLIAFFLIYVRLLRPKVL
jgi:hypothetical protein